MAHDKGVKLLVEVSAGFGSWWPADRPLRHADNSVSYLGADGSRHRTAPGAWRSNGEIPFASEDDAKPALTAAEEQRRGFVHGNVSLSNPNVTREVVDRVADEMAMKLPGTRVGCDYSLDHLTELRAAGWSVAVHNDYRQDGASMTFWLLTYPDGRWVKGEGATDASALEQAYLAASRSEPRAAVAHANAERDAVVALARGVFEALATPGTLWTAPDGSRKAAPQLIGHDALKELEKILR